MSRLPDLRTVLDCVTELYLHLARCLGSHPREEFCSTCTRCRLPQGRLEELAKGKRKSLRKNTQAAYKKGLSRWEVRQACQQQQ